MVSDALRIKQNLCILKDWLYNQHVTVYNPFTNQHNNVRHIKLSDEIDDIMTVDNVNKLVALSENLSSGSLSQEGIVNTIRTLNKEDKKITVSGSKDGE